MKWGALGTHVAPLWRVHWPLTPASGLYSSLDPLLLDVCVCVVSRGPPTKWWLSFWFRFETTKKGCTLLAKEYCCTKRVLTKDQQGDTERVTCNHDLGEYQEEAGLNRCCKPQGPSIKTV